jgi:5-methylcytosine-specific restriction enzyme B
VRLLYSQALFTIPKNVILLGTMNTIDLSTTDIDFALRRRFYFFEVAPNESRLEQVLTDGGRREIDPAFLDLLKAAFLKTLPIYPLGHAYFKDVTNSEELKGLWDYQIRPLLEQYFGTERSKAKDIERLYSPIWQPLP